MLKKTYKKINLKAEEYFPETYFLFYDNRIFVKYFISGCTAAFVDLLLLYILTEYVFSKKYYWISVTLAFIIAFFVSFFMQKFWTFKDRSLDKINGQLAFYMIIAFFGLGVNLLMVMFLVENFEIWYLYSQIIAGAVIACLNFILYNRFVFRTSLVQKNSILLASGIFPPDVGGPAIHSFRFLKEFNQLSIKTSVVTYSDVRKNEQIDGAFEVERVSRKLPFGVRHFFYFLRLMSVATRYDIIYAQDISAAGLPAVFAANLLKKRFFIRIGGDLLWERLAEAGKIQIPMVNFYKNNLYNYKPFYYIGRFVLSRAEKIFVPANFLADIYEKYYFIPKNKLVVITNPMPQIRGEMLQENKSKDILFAGRFVKYRNLSKLISAFSCVSKEISGLRLVLIGDGPEKQHLFELTKKLKIEDRVIFKEKMQHKDIGKEISNAHLCVCPTLTDVNPNFILECLSLNSPVLVTRENGLSIKLSDKFLFNPMDENDLINKLRLILLEKREIILEEIREKIKNSKINSWDDIIEKHLSIFK